MNRRQAVGGIAAITGALIIAPRTVAAREQSQLRPFTAAELRKAVRSIGALEEEADHRFPGGFTTAVIAFEAAKILAAGGSLDGYQWPASFDDALEYRNLAPLHATLTSAQHAASYVRLQQLAGTTSWELNLDETGRP